MSDSAAPSIEPRRRVPLHTKILIGLLIGAALGVTANRLCRRPLSALRAESGWWAVFVNPADPRDVDFNGIDDRLDFVAAQIADPLGRVFLRIMLMIVVPLVFSALTLGVLELGDVRRLGRIGLRTLGLTAVLSLCAVGIGVGLVDLIGPGRGLPPEDVAQLRRQYAGSAHDAEAAAARAKTLSQTLLDMLPENPLQEMAGALDGSSKGNGMLAVMVFSLIVGIALSVVGARGETLVKVLQGVFDVCMVIISFAMRLAPFCVACLLFSVTSRLGAGVLTPVLWFALTVVLGIALQMVVVYSLLVWLVGKRRPLEFYRDISEAIVTAFGTSSSNATLPTALRVANDRLKLPHEVAQFVLTVGATGNQNGTALYEGVVVLFLAQLFGVPLTVVQQMSVVLMSVLAGIGTAGVPGGSLPMIVIVLKTVGVPAEGIGIFLGVDRLLDMCRTVLNVSGDLVLATCVARGEEQRRPAEIAPDSSAPATGRAR